MVLASKAIRAVRNGHPDSEIHLLTSTEAVPLAADYPYVDQVHAFPIRELRKNKGYLVNIARIIRHLQGRKFDLILNLYQVSSKAGAIKMGILLSLLKAGKKIGHDNYGFGSFLTDRVPTDTFAGRHVADAMLEIAFRAGGIVDAKGIEVFWNKGFLAKWEDFFARPTGNIIVGINPGGDRENRRWAPDRFASVAVKIMERFNAGIILLGGPADKSIASYIESRIHSDVSNLSGEIPIDELACVISKLDLLITNDSGPMHIAAATKTPLVALFGPEDPRLFGPYTTPDLYRVLHKDVPCHPCGEEKCTRPLCLDQITPEEVVAACIELLRGKSSEKSQS